MWDRGVLIMQHRVGDPDRLPSHKEESPVRGDPQQVGIPVSKTSTNILGAAVLNLQKIYGNHARWAESPRPNLHARGGES